LFKNIIIAAITDKKYDFLKKYKKLSLTKAEKVPVYKNVRAMLNHKVGSVVISGSTSLILSAFVSIYAVGLYSNYFLIIAALNAILAQIFDAATSSVGNLSVEGQKDKIYSIFKNIFFFNGWIITFSSVCLLILFNPFITLWLGKEMLFPFSTVIMLTINFYINAMRKTSLMFRDAMGLFWYDRKKPIAEAIIGIALAIGLSYKFGTFGVILGFTFATLITSFWIEPYILNEYGFGKKCFDYFFRFSMYFVIFAVSYGIVYYCSSFITGVGWFSLLEKLLICLVVPNFLFFIIFRKKPEFRYFLNIILKQEKK
jgi:hypothetical protein